MPDKIELSFDGRTITDFVDYSIDSDLYVAGDAFSVTLADPDYEINPGAQCKLHVNDRLELTGIIDRVTEDNGKDGTNVVVEGRDLMGLIVDSYCEDFLTLESVTLKEIAGKLLANIPFINRKAIEYQAGIAGATANKTGQNAMFDFGQDLAQIEPGQTVFEVLADYAESRGAMFFSLPDGSFVFGRPKAKGKPDFSVVRLLAGRENNVVHGRRIRDISQRWSKVIVVGQRQGADGFEVADLNTRAEAVDNEVPFYKPYVVLNNNDIASPESVARATVERQRARGTQLVYTMRGHTQNGKNYTVNSMCEVHDEKFRLHDTFLVYGRTFTLDKQRGPLTELRLGPPGVVQ